MPHAALVAACILVPLLAALLASREVRAFLRGTGSIRQTFANAGVPPLPLRRTSAKAGRFAGA